MFRFIIWRLIAALPVLAVVSLISFFIISFVPGDAAAVIAGPSASPEELREIRRTLGLDVAWPQRMIDWYSGLLHGDLGTSFLLNQPVLDALLDRIPITIGLSVYALAIAIPIGVASGCVAAFYQNTWVDRSIMAITLVGVSIPNFIFGLGAIIVFAVWLRFFPAGGYVPLYSDPLGWLHTVTLPAIVLAIFEVGLLSRTTRGTMLEILQQDYIRTARAKGLKEVLVVSRHALRNVLIPVLTVIGLSLSGLIAGSIVIETVYSIPGIGRLLVDAIARRDFPVVQGSMIFIGASFVLINLIVDLLYAAVDPRVTFE